MIGSLKYKSGTHVTQIFCTRLKVRKNAGRNNIKLKEGASFADLKRPGFKFKMFTLLVFPFRAQLVFLLSLPPKQWIRLKCVLPSILCYFITLIDVTIAIANSMIINVLKSPTPCHG